MSSFKLLINEQFELWVEWAVGYVVSEQLAMWWWPMWLLCHPSPNWTWIWDCFGFGFASKGTGLGTRAWQFWGEIILNSTANSEYCHSDWVPKIGGKTKYLRSTLYIPYLQPWQWAVMMSGFMSVESVAFKSAKLLIFSFQNQLCKSRFLFWLSQTQFTK